jgi:hypothetical protein
VQTGSRAPRRLAVGGTAAALALLAVAFAVAGPAGSPSAQVFRSVDTGLCPFKLAVELTRTIRIRQVGKSSVQILGPTRVTVRNVATGRAVVLSASGSSSSDPATGDLRFSGRQLWVAPENHVPYLSTDGTGSQLAPTFVTSGADLHPRVIDPCALVASSRPSTRPVTTPAPWGLPAFPLSQIDYAGLTPLIGSLVRHDHVHLDVLVNARKLTIPAGVGQAEPVYDGRGPCPAPPQHVPAGDCAAGRFYSARVALSPLHPHTTSGIIHIEADRPGTFTLGQFFDEWGVRFSSSCLGGYCTGEGKKLGVFVDGRRVAGDVRRLVLTNRQEIAVVFGGPADFRSVPSSYSGRWPQGCGGRGEHSCFP